MDLCNFLGTRGCAFLRSDIISSFFRVRAIRARKFVLRCQEQVLKSKNDRLS